MSNHLIFGYHIKDTENSTNEEITSYQAVLNKIVKHIEDSIAKDNHSDNIDSLKRFLNDITFKVAMENKDAFSSDLTRYIDNENPLDFMSFTILRETFAIGICVQDPFIAPEDMSHIIQDMEKLFSLVLNEIDSVNTQDFYKDVRVGFFTAQETPLKQFL